MAVTIQVKRGSGAPGSALAAGEPAFDLTNHVLYIGDGAVNTAISGGGSSAWGAITGTLSDQTDLQSALDARQPLDATLTALAGLNTTAGIVVQTGTDVFTKRTLTGTANRITVTNGTGAAGDPTFDIGSDVVTGASTHTFTNKTFDANGTGNSISNLETADFAANVVDTDSTLAANSNTRLASQAAVKSYVDNLVTGLAWKQKVRAATTVNGTLATAYENGDAIDGVTLATGDRILLKNQTTATENGLYVVVASGAPARASDADTGAELVNATVLVSEGTANADTQWTCTNNAAITIGSTNITFAQVSGAGTYTAASGITLTGNQFSLSDMAASRIKGRQTSTGAPQDLTLSEVLDFVGSAAQGDIFYRNATVWVRLAAGTSGHFLQTLGAGANPQWAASTLDITGLTALATAVALDDEVPIWDESASANRKLTVARMLGRGLPGYCGLRLSLTTGVPVTISDVTAAGTLYLTPCICGRISLWDGTRWSLFDMAETSVNLSGLLTASVNYDVSVEDTGGAPDIHLTAWASATARSTALTYQDGVPLVSGDVYVGTIRASGTDVCEDSVTKRFVWNLHHRVPRALRVIETANSWTYTSTTWRSWNNSTANRVELVLGLEEEPVELSFLAAHSSSTTSGYVGIGLDSTSSPVANSIRTPSGPVSAISPSLSRWAGFPGLGYHYLQLLEAIIPGGSTGTFFGDAGVTQLQCGAFGFVCA